MELKTLDINEITPYWNNARKNDEAVDKVAQSIKKCGYVAPIIVDEQNVILAGHTRLKALQQLGYKEVEVQVVNDLDEETKKKYRLLDNKTGEIADWDKTALEEELEKVDLSELDIEWDVTDDIVGNFDESDFSYESQYAVTIICDSKEAQEECIADMESRGFDCKGIVV